MPQSVSLNVAPQESDAAPHYEFAIGTSSQDLSKPRYALQRRCEVRVPVANHLGCAPQRDSQTAPNCLRFSDIRTQPKRTHLPRMLLTQPFQNERCFVRAAVVNEEQHHARVSADKLGERLRIKALRLVVARHH